VPSYESLPFPVTYTPFYCEENAFLLSKSLLEHLDDAPSCPVNGLYVVFISNKTKTVPLWRQRASKTSGHEPIVWDYHVIVVSTSTSTSSTSTVVYDLDTTLNCPLPFESYVTATFRPDVSLRPNFHQFFRLVPAPYFLSHFASDRSHMVCISYFASPPCLFPSSSSSSSSSSSF